MSIVLRLAQSPSSPSRSTWSSFFVFLFLGWTRPRGERSSSNDNQSSSQWTVLLTPAIYILLYPCHVCRRLSFIKSWEVDNILGLHGTLRRDSQIMLKIYKGSSYQIFFFLLKLSLQFFPIKKSYDWPSRQNRVSVDVNQGVPHGCAYGMSTPLFTSIDT